MVKAAKDLGVRTLINGLSAGVIAVLIFLGGIGPLRWIFSLAVAGIAAIAVWEFAQIVKKKGLQPATTLSVIAVILYVCAVFFKTQGPYTYLNSLAAHAPAVILGLAFFGCFLHFAFTDNPPIVHIATTYLGIVYIGVPLGLMVHMMFFFTVDGMHDAHMQGSWWVIYLVAVTKSADIGGYFVGSHFGKRKLAFKLSPNKTLEGALGGLLASMSVSLLICFLGKQFGHIFQEFSYVQAMGLGAIVGIIGQVGDLAESLLKRDAGVKDSNTIPGVGGILDMIDSLLFTAPVVYIFLRIIYT